MYNKIASRFYKISPEAGLHRSKKGNFDSMDLVLFGWTFGPQINKKTDLTGQAGYSGYFFYPIFLIKYLKQISTIFNSLLYLVLSFC